MTPSRGEGSARVLREIAEVLERHKVAGTKDLRNDHGVDIIRIVVGVSRSASATITIESTSAAAALDLTLRGWSQQQEANDALEQ